MSFQSRIAIRTNYCDYSLPKQRSPHITALKPPFVVDNNNMGKDRNSEECEQLEKNEANGLKLAKFNCIPFDVLLTILMAEKDKYIKELADRQICCGIQGNAEGNNFDTMCKHVDELLCKEAEIIALRNKITALDGELQDCRNVLRRIIPQLKNIDDLLIDSDHLRNEYGQQNKKIIEYEETLNKTSAQYDLLQNQMQELQKQLHEAKNAANEVETYKHQLKITSTQLESTSKENDLHKKKLEATKNLEGQLESAKLLAQELSDKYRREIDKSCSQLKQINANTRELKLLWEERDKLQKHIKELTSVEAKYNTLLTQYDSMLAERNSMDEKLKELSSLRLENKELLARIDEMILVKEQVTEAEDKISHLEATIRKYEDEKIIMTSDIEELHRNKDELFYCKAELEETRIKIAEVPVLKAKIEELRNELQKCVDGFVADKELLKRLQEELDVYQKRCNALERRKFVAPRQVSVGTMFEEVTIFGELTACIKRFAKGETVPLDQTRGDMVIDLQHQIATLVLAFEKKEAMSKRDVETLLRSSRGIIAFVLENMIEQQKEIEKFSKSNKELKSKIQVYETEKKVLNDLQQQIEKQEKMLLDRNIAIEEQNSETSELRQSKNRLKERILNLEKELELSKSSSRKLNEELAAVTPKVPQLTIRLKKERKARKFVEDLVKEMHAKFKMGTTDRKLTEELLHMQKEELCLFERNNFFLLNEICLQNSCIKKLKMRVNELKKENNILQDIQHFLRTFDHLSLKIKMPSTELENTDSPVLHPEIKTLVHKMDELSSEVTAITRQALRLDRLHVELEKEKVTERRTEMLNLVAQRDKEIKELKNKLDNSKSEVSNLVNNSTALRIENSKLNGQLLSLTQQLKNLNGELHHQRSQTDKLNEVIKDQERMKVIEEELKVLIEDLNNKAKDLEEIVTAKDHEIGKLRNAPLGLKDEIKKLTSDMDNLRNQFKKWEEDLTPKSVYENALSEKESLQESCCLLNNKVVSLMKEMEDYKLLDLELAKVRAERNELLQKVSQNCRDMESATGEAEKRIIDEFPDTTREREKELLEEIHKLYEALHKLENEITFVREEKKILKNDLETLKTFFDKLKMALGESYFSFIDGDSSGQFEKIMLVEDHRKNVTEIENRCILKIKQSEEVNSDRIKKLTEQFEKESENRNKIFNENINNIKVMYESDIRKLTERHKASIMRLQGLHEDEVQELNVNYETQMETMQTQNENIIRDLTADAAEKCKHLVEKHEQAIKELKAKFQIILHEKETQHMFEMSNLQLNMSQNIDEVDDYYKKTTDDLPQTVQTNITEIQAKHNRELKKMKRSNWKRVIMMKHKYEDLLLEERKKYEEQLESLLDRLTKGLQVDQNELKNECIHLKKALNANTFLELVDILQKIINEKLNSLTIEDAALVHGKMGQVVEALIQTTVDNHPMSSSLKTGKDHSEAKQALETEIRNSGEIVQHNYLFWPESARISEPQLCPTTQTTAAMVLQTDLTAWKEHF